MRKGGWKGFSKGKGVKREWQSDREREKARC